MYTIDERTGPNNCTGPNRYGGPKDSKVRDARFWSETRWSGPYPIFWSAISGPIRDSPDRGSKDINFFGPNNSVRNRSNPNFSEKCFII